MEKTYKANADEALSLAAQSVTAGDRRFWLNIARAWIGLLELLGTKR